MLFVVPRRLRVFRSLCSLFACYLHIELHQFGHGITWLVSTFYAREHNGKRNDTESEYKHSFNVSLSFAHPLRLGATFFFLSLPVARATYLFVSNQISIIQLKFTHVTHKHMRNVRERLLFFCSGWLSHFFFVPCSTRQHVHYQAFDGVGAFFTWAPHNNNRTMNRKTSEKHTKQTNEHKLEWSVEKNEMRKKRQQAVIQHRTGAKGRKKNENHESRWPTDERNVWMSEAAIKTAQVHTRFYYPPLFRITKWHRYTEWQESRPVEKSRTVREKNRIAGATQLTEGKKATETRTKKILSVQKRFNCIYWIGFLTGRPWWMS